MFRLPFYGKDKLLLAFEFGLTLSEVANKLKVEVNSDVSKRAEEIILKEFSEKNAERIAIEFIPNILAALEPKERLTPPEQAV